jgi:hypothetical protein
VGFAGRARASSGVDGLRAQPEHDQAGRQDRQPGTAGQQLVEVACGVDQVLQVVEYEQPLAIAEVVDQGLKGSVPTRQVCPRGPADVAQHHLGPRDGRQRNEHGAVAEVLAQPLADRDREPRLADPTRARERDQPHVAPHDQIGDLVDGLLPTDQWGRRRG